MHHIVALLGQAFELLGHFVRFFLGPEIDAAQSFAVVAQGRKFALDFIERRHLAVLKPSILEDLLRGAMQRLGDTPLGFGMALAR